jgi:hypothetical protein
MLDIDREATDRGVDPPGIATDPFRTLPDQTECKEDDHEANQPAQPRRSGDLHGGRLW